MDRKLVIALSSLLSGMTLSEAQAIGLGDIRLHSALNEPLRAEIKLVQVKDLNENQIIVNLASPDDFAKAHVDRDYLLNSLRFQLDLDDPRNPKVVVSTSQPIREPFLNFLVEVQWPSGRLLREYTLLMDLPVYKQAQTPDSIEAPVTQEYRQPSPPKQAKVAAPAVESRPAPKIEPTVTAAPVQVTKPKEPPKETVKAPEQPQAKVAEQAKPATPVAEKPVSNGTYGPTRTNDTLWRIAQRVKGSGNVQQKILAIQRLNPEAFNKNNVNLLKTGKVLKLPSQEEIASIGRAEAAEKMKEQVAAWKSGTTLPAPAGAQVDATGRAQQPTPVAAQPDGQLKLATPAPAVVTAGASTKAAQSAGEQSAAADVASLKNDLAVGMEELNRAQRENQDVTSRIKDLDAQKDSAAKLIQLQSNELASLQARLAAEQQAAADAKAKSDADAKAKADANAQTVAAQPPQPATPPSSSQPTAAATPQVEEKAPQAAAPPVKPVEKTKPVAPIENAAEPSIVDQLTENPVFAGAGVVVLLLLGLLGFRKKAVRRAAEQEDDGIDFEPVAFATEEAEQDLEPAEDVAAEAEQSDEAPLEVTANEPVYDANLQPESGDALGEADIYISFGNFDKGAALLKSAINKEPTRSDYRLKLLELYKESGNLDAFDLAYRDLIELDDDAAIARAGTLRAAVPGAADKPFAFGVSSAAAAEGITDDFDLDFDLSAEQDEAGIVDLNDESAVKIAADVAPTLDDLEDVTITPSEPEHVLEKEDDSAFDMNFDMDADIAAADLVKDDAQAVEIETVDSVADAEGEAAGFDLDFDLDLDLPADDEAPVLDLTEADFDVAMEEAAASDAPATGAAMPDAVIAEIADAGEIDEELDFLNDADEAATKLDLARAYIDMGDKDGARDILAEVLDEGRDEQKREAQALLDSIG